MKNAYHVTLLSFSKRQPCVRTWGEGGGAVTAETQTIFPNNCASGLAVLLSVHFGAGRVLGWTRVTHDNKDNKEEHTALFQNVFNIMSVSEATAGW